MPHRSFPYIAFIASLVILNTFYAFSGSLSPIQSLAAYLIVYTALASIPFAVSHFTGRNLSDLGFSFAGIATKAVIVASFLVFLYSFIWLEPGVVYGFSPNLTSPTTISFFIIAAPLVAIAEEGVYRGVIMRELSRRGSFHSGLYTSSVIYALSLTNFFVLFSLNFLSAIQYLFQTTFNALLLGVTMGILFYKLRWSLLGPFIFRTGLTLVQNISPILPKSPGWEYAFVFQLLALSVVIVLASLLLREPGFMVRLYLGEKKIKRKGRLGERARILRTARGALIGTGIAALLVLTSYYAVHSFLGTSTPIVAVASGSMAPTLHRGDLVVVQGGTNLSVGDIIVFKVPQEKVAIVHRIVGIVMTSSGPLYFTKGDANTARDTWSVSRSEIDGKVVGVVPFLGYFIIAPAFTFLTALTVMLVPFLRPKGRFK